MVVLKRLMAVAVLVGSMALASVGASAAGCDTAQKASGGSANCQVTVNVTTSTFANVQAIDGVSSWSFTLSGDVDGTTGYLYDAGDVSANDYGFDVKSNNKNLTVQFGDGVLAFGDKYFCPVYKFPYAGTDYYYRPADTGTTGGQSYTCANPGLSPADWASSVQSNVSIPVGVGDGSGNYTISLSGFAVEVNNPNDLPSSEQPSGSLTVTIQAS